jgi:hypothetical protein
MALAATGQLGMGAAGQIRLAVATPAQTCRDPVKMSFLRSLVVIWRARIPVLRCGEVVISLILRAVVTALRAVPGGLTLWP